MEPDGQCPVCGLVEVHEPGCSPLRARVFRARAERDHALAALGEVYQPRLRTLHDEYARRRDAIWARYQARVEELKAAA